MNKSYRSKNIESGEEFQITDAGIMIGRDEECDVTLKSADVSRKHALLKLQDNKPMLTDNASTNGTMLNKWRIRETESLNHGDVITIAEFSFVVIEPGAEADLTISHKYLPSNDSFAVEEGDGDETSFHISYPKPPGWDQDDLPEFEKDNSGHLKLMEDLLRVRRINGESAAGAFMELSDKGRNEIHIIPKAAQVSLSLGRSRDCDITLEDHTISSHHATLSLEGKLIKLRDENSSNGMKVNGKRLSETAIKSGDEIHLGSFALLFKAF